MKKKLLTEDIANELEGASLFFTKPAAPLSSQESVKNIAEIKTNPLAASPFFETSPNPPPEAQIDINQDQKRTFERSNERTMERTNVPLRQNRVRIRHTFDIYQDQLVALQGIQFEKVQAGKKKPKLGKMVSDGIDLYLKQWASKNKQG